MKVLVKEKVLDHGFLQYVEHWGSDKRIVESARMSTDKGFLGWGNQKKPGDEKLLAYLYNHKHSTPFEFAGLTIEIQAPIFVFREWHRHRTQCLAPDTLIHFDAPKSRENRRFIYKMRIEDIWKKWQPTIRAARPERQTNALFPRSRIQAMRLRCLDESQKEIIHTRIVDVIKGEPKPMVRVMTASGRQLTATRKHLVVTSLGWMQLGDAISKGALLALEGTTRGLTTGWEVPPVDESTEVWAAVFGWEGLYEVSNQGRVRRIGCDPKRLSINSQNGYQYVGLNRPGEQVARTVHSLVMEAFHGSADGREVRHENHNRLDARLENLQYGTSLDNSADQVSVDRQQRLVPVFEEIVQVDEAGVLPTYDLAVDGPYHNFIADGFVVHNSYSELSARYAPMPDYNYIPTVDRLLMVNTANKQANSVKGSDILTLDSALAWLTELQEAYDHCEQVYQNGLKIGVPKELARLPVPVARYSRMRATANLRNWLGFMTLRDAPNAQWEIREYAKQVGVLLKQKFPRTWNLYSLSNS